VKKHDKNTFVWMYLLSGPLSTKIRLSDDSERSCTVVLQIIAVGLIQHSVGARGIVCM